MKLMLLKRERNMTKIQNMSSTDYLDPDKKHYDSCYTVELDLPVGQMLKVRESILIFQKLQQHLYVRRPVDINSYSYH